MMDFLFKKYLYHIILAAFTIWMLFFDANSWLNHRKLNNEIESLKRQKNFLIKEIQKDRYSLFEIKTPEGRERFGRENYYFKKDDEDIYIIEYDTIK